MKAFALRFWLPTIFLALVSTVVQQYYVVRSEAITPGALAELPFVSSTHLLSFFERRKGTWADTVFSDTINFAAAPIQGYYVNPSRIIFLSGDWYDGVSNPRTDCITSPCVFVASADKFAAFAKLRAMREAMYWRRAAFDFSRRGKKNAVDTFNFDLRGTDAHLTQNTQMIEQVRESVLNHWEDVPRPGSAIYRVRKPSAMKNHLVFVSGSIGVMHAMSFGAKVGLYGIERDPFYRGSVMSALGRYLLFRTIAPSDRVRVALWVSASFDGPGNDHLPPAVAVGKRREPFGLVGYGSARVFSSVLVPRSMDDMRFIGLDMGRAPAPIPQPPRTGLMQLYGRHVILDPRLVTAWARDISLVSNRRYMRMRPPASVSRFPADLANPTLQYSGVYEDGWISNRAYFILQPPAPKTDLVVRALVPLLGNPSYRTRVCVRLDAGPPICSVQGPGQFSFIQAVSSAARHRVEIDIAKPQRLPTGDQRLLGARIEFVGFKR